MAISSARRAAQSLLSSPKISSSEVINHGVPFAVGLPYSLCRLYTQYRFCGKGLASHTLLEAKTSLWKYRDFRKFYIKSASNKISHHALIAWRTVSQFTFYSGPILPPISRFVCAVSLALTRSQLVAPSIFAFLVSELAWTQRTIAHADGFPISNNFYMQAQDGHIYLSSFLFSLVEALILCLRAMYLTILFTPCIAMAPFADSLGIEFRKTWLHIVHFTLERAGPAFIKWGQWAATRPDLFPSDLCTELAKLQTKAPAHNYAYTKRAIENAFGRKLPEIFEKFDEEPVASGSIAQVHRATLKYRYPGQKIKPVLVAVKVRHPGVGEAIRRDFTLINLIAKISKFIPTLKWLRLDESIQQFAVFMMSQVDLAREAAHLSRFIYNFRRWKDVSFPKPLYPLVHPAVLVETYEHGESVSHYVDELEGHGNLKSGLAHLGTHALLKMLLIGILLIGKTCFQLSILHTAISKLKVDNFIHADMHPGNILVRVSPRKASLKGPFKSKPHVVFLDVGMTAELSNKDRVNLIEFFKAVALQDGRTAAECTLKFSKHQNCPQPSAFIQEVEKSFDLWSSVEGEMIHPAECMQQLLENVRRHRVNIDGNVCTVMVTTLVLESWQRKLDPDYDVMHTLQTLLFKVDWAESLFYTIEGLMAP